MSMEFEADQAVEVIQNTPVVLRALLRDVTKSWVMNN